MGRKVIRHIWNVISGIYVLLFSLWLSGPGIAETGTPTYRWYFMLWFVVWVSGFLLQFTERFRVIGVVITLSPFIYYLVTYLRVAFM
ncbi:hypothetical protein SAMN04244570_0960 [Sporosarcina newyorkensis]|uniref:Uncharacterized protein n=1 Tax=Sporosarcina newyorkensis TaxID=759851 RepID=A0A1T4XMP4_9BACL|nr:hypothetical protein SAMN04244570_0960 [Sporosarcina newyorkensis]